MSERREPSPRAEAIEDEARAWFVRNRRNGPESFAPGYAAWRGVSPDHAAAYDRVAQLYADAAILRTSARFGVARDAVRSAGPRSRRQKRWWLAGGTAMAAVLLGFLLAEASRRVEPVVSAAALAPDHIITMPGEIRRVALADGSVAVLDGDTAIEVRIGAGERRLRIARGRARFLVAAHRLPFVVDAGAGSIVAQAGSGGSTFDVLFAERSIVQVYLTRGVAELHPGARLAALAPRSLTAGGAFTYRAADFVPLAPTGDPGSSWQQEWPLGWTEHDRITLGDLVAEANRYAAVPIRIDDPALAKMVVSGRFRIGDSDEFVRGIARLLDLEVRTRAGEIRLVRKNF